MLSWKGINTCNAIPWHTPRANCMLGVRCNSGAKIKHNKKYTTKPYIYSRIANAKSMQYPQYPESWPINSKLTKLKDEISSLCHHFTDLLHGIWVHKHVDATQARWVSVGWCASTGHAGQGLHQALSRHALFVPDWCLGPTTAAAPN